MVKAETNRNVNLSTVPGSDRLRKAIQPKTSHFEPQFQHTQTYPNILKVGNQSWWFELKVLGMSIYQLCLPRIDSERQSNLEYFISNHNFTKPKHTQHNQSWWFKLKQAGMSIYQLYPTRIDVKRQTNLKHRISSHNFNIRKHTQTYWKLVTKVGNQSWWYELKVPRMSIYQLCLPRIDVERQSNLEHRISNHKFTLPKHSQTYQNIPKHRFSPNKLQTPNKHLYQALGILIKQSKLKDCISNDKFRMSKLPPHYSAWFQRFSLPPYYLAWFQRSPLPPYYLAWFQRSLLPPYLACQTNLKWDIDSGGINTPLSHTLPR